MTNAAGLGEKNFGAAKGMKDFIMTLWERGLKRNSREGRSILFIFIKNLSHSKLFSPNKIF